MMQGSQPGNVAFLCPHSCILGSLCFQIYVLLRGDEGLRFRVCMGGKYAP